MKHGGWIGVLMLAVVASGCAVIDKLSPSFSEKMLLSIQVDGPKAVPKTGLGEIPVPLGGVLTAELLRAYGAPYLQRAAQLDNCKLATAHEPATPDALGVITVSGSMLCELPNGVNILEVVTFTLSPVAEEA